jgi:hypothetical protein
MYVQVGNNISAALPTTPPCCLLCGVLEREGSKGPGLLLKDAVSLPPAWGKEFVHQGFSITALKFDKLQNLLASPFYLDLELRRGKGRSRPHNTMSQSVRFARPFFCGPVFWRS